MEDNEKDIDKRQSPIRVVLADTSLMLRRAMSRIIGKSSGIVVLAAVETTEETLEAVRHFFPDVLVMDLAGEGLDGLAVLRQLRVEKRRCAVILFANQDRASAESTIQGMELGASDFVAKPLNGSFAHSLSIIEHELLPRVRGLGRHARPLSGRSSHSTDPSVLGSRRGSPGAAGETAVCRSQNGSFPTGVVAIGASTGGPEALMRLLPAIPSFFPSPILVVQHMPPVFTATLAGRLDQVASVRVVEALDGEPLLGGTVYIAPGGRHMTVCRQGRLLRVRLNDDPPVKSCRPSVNVLFESVARLFGAEVVGVVLTGMGTDGTEGARTVRESGGMIFVQSAETCLINGMPKSVSAAGLANEELSLSDIAGRLREIFECEQ